MSFQLNPQAYQTFSEVEAAGDAEDPLKCPPLRAQPGVMMLNVYEVIVDDDTGNRQLAKEVIHQRDMDGDMHTPLESMRAYWRQRRLQETIYGSIWLCMVLKPHHCCTEEEDASETTNNKNINWKVVREESPVAMEQISWAQAQKVRSHLAEDPTRKIGVLQHLGNNILQLQEKQNTGHDSSKKSQPLRCMACTGDVFSIDHDLYAVLPYSSDGDMFDLVYQYTDENATSAAMPEPVARFWFRQLLQGLNIMQEAGICHRDLSLENLLLYNRGDQCMIIDFGMCLFVPYGQGKAVDDGHAGTHQKIRRLMPPQGKCGKIGYRSPEVHANMDNFDGFAVDLWAAGVILYIMLTGIPPYECPNRQDQLFEYNAVHEKLAELLTSWDIHISREAGDLLQKMLRCDPRQRLTLAEVMVHPWVAQGKVQQPEKKKEHLTIMATTDMAQQISAGHIAATSIVGQEVTVDTATPPDDGEAQISLLSPQEIWLEKDGKELDEVLRSGAIALLSAKWLVEFCSNETHEAQPAVLPRRQNLPPQAFLTCDEIIASTTKSEGIQIIVLSYMWLHPNHPDPQGTTLKLISEWCDAWLKKSAIDSGSNTAGANWAIFWDYASLFQHPNFEEGKLRTPEEERLFQDGLNALPLLFAHPYTYCFRNTVFPAGYPASYNLPENANCAEYSKRGWPFVESCWASMTKSPQKTWDIGKDSPSTFANLALPEHRSPPLSPERVQQQLERLTFFTSKSDLPLVMRLYRDQFVRRFSMLTELAYSGLGWDDEQIEQLSNVIGLGYTPNVRILDLSYNAFGVRGCASLVDALQHVTEKSPNLDEIVFTAVRFGDEGVRALSPLLVQVARVRLDNSDVGAVGCKALADAAQNSATMCRIRELNFSHNKEMGDEGVRFLADLFARNCTRVDLGSVGLGDAGCKALAQAWEESNNSALECLILYGNRQISGDGIQALADLLVRIPRVDLSGVDIGDMGCKALASAAAAANPVVLALKDLNLHHGNHSISCDEGARHLRKLVAQCPKLTHLALPFDLESLVLVEDHLHDVDAKR